MGPIKQVWSGVEAGVAGKLGAVKADLAELTQKVETLGDVAGFGPEVTAIKDQVTEKLSALTKAVPELTAGFEKSKQEILTAIAGSKLEEATKLVEAAKTGLPAQLSQVTELADSAKQLLAKLETAVTDAKAKAAANPLTRLLHQPGKVDFSNIDFRLGSAEFNFERPTSKEALDQLVAFAKTCPEMRLNLVGHTSKEGKEAVNLKISKARAVAVKNHLVKEGVPAAVIASVSGKGSAAPLVAEVKTMDADALAAARTQNRRIEVDVTTACPAP